MIHELFYRSPEWLQYSIMTIGTILFILVRFFKVQLLVLLAVILLGYGSLVQIFTVLTVSVFMQIGEYYERDIACTTKYEYNMFQLLCCGYLVILPLLANGIMYVLEISSPITYLPLVGLVCAVVLRAQIAVRHVSHHYHQQVLQRCVFC